MTVLARFALAPLLLVGCAGSASVAPRTPAPPSAPSSAPTAPPSVVEAAADPSEIRCGVDDGPVPIGAREDGLRDAPPNRTPSRLFADARPFLGEAPAIQQPMLLPAPLDFAKPRLSVNHTTPADIVASPALLAQATACAEAAQSGDEGERSFVLRLSASGSALSVRAGPTRDATNELTSCLARALCAIGPQAPSAAARAVPVRMVAAVAPPVFRGSVSALLGFTSGPATVRVGRRGRAIHVPNVPPAKSRADEAYITHATAALQKGVRGCAERFPPTAPFSLRLDLRVDTAKARVNVAKANWRAPVATPGQEAPYLRTFRLCVSESIASEMPPPPPAYVRAAAPIVEIVVDPDDPHDAETGTVAP